MIRLAIVVEGQTEEEFVKTVLAGHLREKGVEAYPRLPGSRGGNISVERLAPEMVKLWWNFDCVTSLVDYYGFRRRQAGESVEELEARIDEAVDRGVRRDWNRSRMFAYVQRHEFEGLLFSEVDAFGTVLNVSRPDVEALRRIRATFLTPEDINRETAPSKRIMSIVPSYRKVTYGPLLAEEAGLERIRNECPRFNAWVSRLESLG